MTLVPRVSVCMVTYRHEKYIRQAVESALSQQTTFPFEVVVSDDASPDNTGNILKQLASEHTERLVARIHPKNLGGALNFQQTYASCRGDLIALLEGDDYWTDPHKLQRQVDALDRHPEWSGCFHPAEYVDPDGQPLGRRHPAELRAEIAFDDLCAMNWVQTCSLIVRKSAVPQIPEWINQMAIGDWPLCLIATTTGPLGMLPDPMSCYRVHPGGIWSSQSRYYRLGGFLRAYTTVAEHLPPEFTLRLMRAQQILAEQILNERESIASSLTYRLGSVLTWPLIKLNEVRKRRLGLHLWH